MQIGCIVAYYHCKATNKNLDMKTISKHYQCAGNVVLIQLESVEGEGFGFRTATSAMNDGGLLVKEVRQEGSVNTLLAMNQTGDYLLLTDMDLLKGAKQNRVVNTSVLIAPHSKREIDVSCVERSRWSYDSPTFEPAPSTMDSKMRAAKAHSLRDDIKHKSSGTQSKIWGMINDELRAYNMDSPSEDYNSILESKAKREVVQHRFDLKNGCNGLAVFEGKKLVAFDIFGIILISCRGMLWAGLEMGRRKRPLNKRRLFTGWMSSWMLLNRNWKTHLKRNREPSGNTAGRPIRIIPVLI